MPLGRSPWLRKWAAGMYLGDGLIGRAAGWMLPRRLTAQVEE